MKRYLPAVLLLIILVVGTIVWLRSPGTPTGKSDPHRSSSPAATSDVPASDETEFQRSGPCAIRARISSSVTSVARSSARACSGLPNKSKRRSMLLGFPTSIALARVGTVG